jgi:dihydropyrimidinase
MAAFDLVVRNARVATASDTFECDIGIRGGRIAQLGPWSAASERSTPPTAS